MRIGSSAATRAALLVGLVVLASGPSRAADFTLDILQNGASIGSYDETDFSCQSFGSHEQCSSFSLLTSGDLALDGGIVLDIDPDPAIGGDFTVTNNGATARYTFIFTATVAPIAVTTVTSGSVDGGGSDGSGDSAVLMTTVDNGNLNAADDAFYAAMIDGLLYDTLVPHPTTASPPNALSTQFPHDEFGSQVYPDQPGPVVNSNIGITWDFQMTGGGDTASFTGVFTVKPVPEPGTGLLVALGLAALARAGRVR
jgi:PEP-CTERM motif